MRGTSKEKGESAYEEGDGNGCAFVVPDDHHGHEGETDDVDEERDGEDEADPTFAEVVFALELHGQN